MYRITYTRRIVELKDGKITVERSIENGVEVVEAPLPLVLTVDGAAAPAVRATPTVCFVSSVRRLPRSKLPMVTVMPIKWLRTAV